LVFLVLQAVLGVGERRCAASGVGEGLWTMCLLPLVVSGEGEEDVGCTGAFQLRVKVERVVVRRAILSHQVDQAVEPEDAACAGLLRAAETVVGWCSLTMVVVVMVAVVEVVVGLEPIRMDPIFVGTNSKCPIHEG
jgi:hypothetical protein